MNENIRDNLKIAGTIGLLEALVVFIFGILDDNPISIARTFIGATITGMLWAIGVFTILYAIEVAAVRLFILGRWIRETRAKRVASNNPVDLSKRDVNTMDSES